MLLHLQSRARALPGCCCTTRPRMRCHGCHSISSSHHHHFPSQHIPRNHSRETVICRHTFYVPGAPPKILSASFDLQFHSHQRTGTPPPCRPGTAFDPGGMTFATTAAAARAPILAPAANTTLFLAASAFGLMSVLA